MNPVMDIRPGKEHISRAISPIETDDAFWLSRRRIDPGSLPSQKRAADFASDPNSVRIIKPDENPEENGP